eukprot:4768017-Pleurochrysis_carterae.AAC.2
MIDGDLQSNSWKWCKASAELEALFVRRLARQCIRLAVRVYAPRASNERLLRQATTCLNKPGVRAWTRRIRSLFLICDSAEVEKREEAARSQAVSSAKLAQ